MRVLRSIGIVATGFLLALSIPAGAAPAGSLAPGYVSSEPEDGAMLDHPPEQVEVTFDEPLDPESTLRVEDECGRQVDDGNVRVQATQMTVGIELTPSGDYTVTWLAKGIAGATGQDTGSFSFMVHHGPACHGGDGGGHGDHDGGDGGEGDGGGGGGEGDGGGGGHGGHDGGGSENQHTGQEGSAGGTDHGSMDHDSSTGVDHEPGRHATMDHSQMKHPGKNGKHANHMHAKPGAGSAQNPPRADPGGDPPIAPNGTAVVLALGLSLALGGVGGWFLRVSGAR